MVTAACHAAVVAAPKLWLSKSSAVVAAAFGMKNEQAVMARLRHAASSAANQTRAQLLQEKLWHGAASSGLHPNAP